MDPLPDISCLDRMNRLEKIRFLAEISAQGATARAEVAWCRAQVEAIALRLGVALMALENDQVVWRGKPMEWLLTEPPEIEDDDIFDDEDDEADAGHQTDGPWPIHIEVDLLDRVRKEGFDLGELLDEHYQPREHDCLVKATVGLLKGDEWLAALTAVDMDALNQITYVFSLNRQV